MRIIFLGGGHCKFAAAFRKLLNKNADLLRANGVFAPRREEFSPLVREAYKNGDTGSTSCASILQKIGVSPDDKVVIFLNEHFWASTSSILERGKFYADANKKTSFICELFGDFDLDLIIAIESLPTFFARKYANDLELDLLATDKEIIAGFSWVTLFTHLVENGFCDRYFVVQSEQAPAKMAIILDALVATPNKKQIVGAYDYLRKELTPDGEYTLDKLLAQKNTTQLDNRLLCDLLEVHRKEEDIAERLDDIGIGQDLFLTLNANYALELERFDALSRENSRQPPSIVFFGTSS